MNSKDKWLIFAQIVVGAVFGLAGAGVSYLIFDTIWRRYLIGLADGGFLYAILIGITILLCFGATFVSAGEGVRLMGKLRGKRHSRRLLYKGAFLGTSATIALMSLTNVNWNDILIRFSPPMRLIVQIVRLICLIVSLPFRFLLWIKFPAILLFAVAAPIGALIVEKINLIQPTRGKGEEGKA
ncbi:TPA: hypothetical protein EYP37_05455 [Candidatus Poribacteria bacterium]|nr:hypothetical protein [Candidatus Poribacteria bacterium]